MTAGNAVTIRRLKPGDEVQGFFQRSTVIKGQFSARREAAIVLAHQNRLVAVPIAHVALRFRLKLARPEPGDRLRIRRLEDQYRGVADYELEISRVPRD